MDKTISLAERALNKWLVIAILLTLGFAQLLRIEVGALTFYSHDLLIVIFIVFNLRNLPRIIINKDFQVFAVFSLILLLGLVISLTRIPPSVVGLNALYSLRLVTYLLFYFLLYAKKRIIAPFYLALPVLIGALIGLTQYFLIPDMRWAQYLGWDDHLNRLTMPHYDPTFSGVFLTLGFFALQNLYKTSLSALLLIPILFTYARSVWLSLVITILLTIKNKILAFGIISIISVLILFLPKRFGEGNNLLRTYSVSSRLTHDLAVLKTGMSHPLFGVGMNNLAEIAPSTIPNHAQSANNSYIYLFATSGVFGLSSFLYLVYRLYNTSPHKNVWIFFLVSSCFNNVLFYPFTLLYVLVLSATAPSES